MVVMKQARKLIGPTDNLRFATARRLNRWPQLFGATNRHREINAKMRQPLHELRCAARCRMDHVQNTRLRIAGRQLSVRCQVGKFWAHRKSECFNFLRRDSGSPEYCGTLFVWSEEIVGIAAVPNSIH